MSTEQPACGDAQLTMSLLLSAATPSRAEFWSAVPGYGWDVLGEYPQRVTCRVMALGSRLTLLLTQMDPQRPCALCGLSFLICKARRVRQDSCHNVSC